MSKYEAITLLRTAAEVRTRGHARSTPDHFPVLEPEYLAGLLAGLETLPDGADLPISRAEMNGLTVALIG